MRDTTIKTTTWVECREKRGGVDAKNTRTEEGRGREALYPSPLAIKGAVSLFPAMFIFVVCRQTP